MPRCIVKSCVYHKSANYVRDKASVHLFRQNLGYPYSYFFMVTIFVKCEKVCILVDSAKGEIHLIIEGAVVIFVLYIVQFATAHILDLS